MRELLLALLALVCGAAALTLVGARHRGYRVTVLRRAALGLLLALASRRRRSPTATRRATSSRPADTRVYMTLGATDAVAREAARQTTTQQVTDAGCRSRSR